MSVLRRPLVRPRRNRRPGDEDPLVFAGSASPRLTAAICRELDVDVAAGEMIRFSDGNLFVRVLENVRGRSVYLVQSTVFPTNANFMELLFWIDAFSRASADSVTVVVPYFSYAKGDKVREGHGETAELVEIIGDVAGRDAVVVDDFTISAGTLVEAAEQLVERGARSVTAVVTHGVFAEGSMERLDQSPIERLIVTDSIETQPVELSAKVTVVSVAPLFAEAIGRIHRRESISVLFQE